MRAELPVAVEMRAFDKQMQIEIAEHRRETISVIEFVFDIAPPDTQPVRKSARLAGERGDEEAVRVPSLGFTDDVASRGVDDRDGRRARQHSPHDQPAAILVHAEKRERVAVTRRHDRLDLRVGTLANIRAAARGIKCRRALANF